MDDVNRRVMKVVPRVMRGLNVVLEPISLSHTKGLWEIGQESNDWLYMPRPCFCSFEDTENWVKDALALSVAGEQVTYVLISPTTKKLMGSTRYLNIQGRHRGLEIGWTWLGKTFQRSAVNTEAKYLLLSHAFDVLKAHRVEFKTDARNVRSQQAIQRIGATKEGVFRRHAVVQNGFVRDSVYFSVIDTEWSDVKLSLEEKLEMENA